jgi:hypothetical protein
MLFVPLHAVLKFDTRTAKHIQCTANGQVDLAIAKLLHQLQILDRSSATSICDGYIAPFSELGDELMVDSTL